MWESYDRVLNTIAVLIAGVAVWISFKKKGD